MTGIALARAGLHVTILEKARENRPGGAGLQVDAGFLDQTKTARLLRKLTSGGKKSIQLWSALESSLRTEAQSYSKIDLRFDTRVQTAGQDDDAAWVVTDKDETVRGGILIGADGHRSIVRPHVAPQKPDATFSGYLVWFAAINEDELPENSRPDDSVPAFRMLGGINGGFFFGSVFNSGNGSSGSGDR